MCAIEMFCEFVVGGLCYVGMSWGKDLMVVVYFVWCVGVGLIVWFLVGFIENFDCVFVCDVFFVCFFCEYYEVDVSEVVLCVFYFDVEGEVVFVVVGYDGYQDVFECVLCWFGC